MDYYNQNLYMNKIQHFLGNGEPSSSINIKQKSFFKEGGVSIHQVMKKCIYGRISFIECIITNALLVAIVSKWIPSIRSWICQCSYIVPIHLHGNSRVWKESRWNLLSFIVLPHQEIWYSPSAPSST